MKGLFSKSKSNVKDNFNSSQANLHHGANSVNKKDKDKDEKVNDNNEEKVYSKTEQDSLKKIFELMVRDSPE